jgi:glycosyltransferase involved in cell wall biosynthesis
MVDGGVAIATGRLVTRLRQYGHTVIVLTTPPLGAPASAPARLGSAPTNLRVIYNLVPDPLQTPAQIDSLYHWLQDQQQQQPVDVMLAYYAYPSGYLAVRLGKRLNLPVVCSCRGNDISKDLFIDPDTLAVVLQESSRLIFVSASLLHMADTLVPCRHKATIIANGVDGAAFTPSPETNRTDRTAVIIGTSGLMRWKKGLDLFLPLVRQLCATRHVCFHIAGYPLDALATQQITDFLERHQLRQRFICLGPLSHDRMAAALRRMDIYVSTSYQEGMPNGILEAMACALPVVATEADGIHQLVEDGVTGYLCAAGDLQALVWRCQALIDRPALRASFGQAGRQRVLRHFDADREAAAVTAVLHRAVNP